MPELNVDLPGFQCLLRREYLYNLEEHEGEFESCFVFGASSQPGRAVGFHVMTELGAMIWRLPVSAIATKRDAPHRRHDVLQLWDCFSENMTVTEFSHLVARKCQTILKDGTKLEGRLVLTFDWWGSGYADNPGDEGHKCGHLIELEEGNFAIQPNNRILNADPATITKPYAERPDYKTNQQIWRCESSTRWTTEDSDRMFYDVEDEEPCGKTYEEDQKDQSIGKYTPHWNRLSKEDQEKRIREGEKAEPPVNPFNLADPCLVPPEEREAIMAEREGKPIDYRRLRAKKAARAWVSNFDNLPKKRQESAIAQFDDAYQACKMQLEGKKPEEIEDAIYKMTHGEHEVLVHIFECGCSGSVEWGTCREHGAPVIRRLRC